MHDFWVTIECALKCVYCICMQAYMYVYQIVLVIVREQGNKYVY